MIQISYNEEHGIVPKTVLKSHDEILQGTIIAEEKYEPETGLSSRRDGPELSKAVADPVARYLTDEQRTDLIKNLREEMLEASENLDFERAAELRDSIRQLEAAVARTDK